jgi:phosphoribosyl-dephospho-CoA transferase
VRPGSPAPTHDLLRLRDPTRLRAELPLPSWVTAALQTAPWVVVRRGHVREELIPVGVRGVGRAQRFAAFAKVADIAEQRSPESLAAWPSSLAQPRRDAIAALAALTRVAPVLARLDKRWGPGGSVGFELASGVPTATATSDLDLVIRQHHRLDPGDARELLAALVAAAAPARIDVLLETALGGVALAELAAGPARVLIRTPLGPRLRVDPWLS